MNASEKGTFYYHACANPIGGSIVEPVQHLLSAQGSAALAQAGGHATGTAGPHRLHGIVKFRTAYSELHGSGAESTRGKVYVSTATSVLEGLDVLDGRVKADAIVAKLTVRHPHDGGHPSVSFRGTHFENLTIDGSPVHPDLDLQTFARTEEHAGRPGALPMEHEAEMLAAAKEHHDRLVSHPKAPSWVAPRYRRMGTGTRIEGEGVFVCSLVKSVRVKEPAESFGHIIHVPDAGNLFLSEVLMKHRMFRVTMLRFELGCAVRGQMSCASVDSNGSMMPGVDGG